MARLIFAIVFLPALIAASQASAGLLFHFTEEGDDVKMTASGSIDTTGLVASTNCEPACEWWGVGYYPEGDNYLMGRQHDPVTEAAFGFNTGTSLSPWDTTNGPFTGYDFTSFVVHEDDGKTFALLRSMRARHMRQGSLSILMTSWMASGKRPNRG